MCWPGAEGKKPTKIKIKRHNIRANSVKKQPTPIHDYINFKKMSGNEIILNLDNHENLANSEFVSALLELGKRDKKQEFDWNAHPVTQKCLEDLKERLPKLNAKHVL